MAGVSVPEAVQQQLQRIAAQLAAKSQEAFEPVTDRFYAQRLEKALQKNFDYINRKDNNLLNPQSSSKKSSTSAFGYDFSGVASDLKSVLKNNASKAISKTGIGSLSQVQQQVFESSSVYVSGLPHDITEEELDILFCTQGKIKKIKIYTNPNGQKKGDALITYTTFESAASACIKYNKLDIGDGITLNVVRASFEGKGKNDNEGYKSSTDNHNMDIVDTEIDEHENTQYVANLQKSLPKECEARKYPVVLVLNAYDPNYSSSEEEQLNYFQDLEADMLIECCQFGTIKVMQLMTPDLSIPETLVGSIAITFENEQSARDCATSLHLRWFELRQLEALLLLPSNFQENDNIITQFSSIPPPPLPPKPPSMPKPTNYMIQFDNNDQISVNSTTNKINDSKINNKSILQGNILNIPYLDENEDITTESHSDNNLNKASTEHSDSNVPIEAIEEDMDNFLNSLL
eukprot:gene4175-5942_t